MHQPLCPLYNLDSDIAADTPKTTYKPGEKMPKAGIYKAVHVERQQSHEVSVKKDEKFPACKHCGTRVSFELVSDTG